MGRRVRPRQARWGGTTNVFWSRTAASSSSGSKSPPAPELHALKDELAARGVFVSHNAVWQFLRREGLRFKKTLFAVAPALESAAAFASLCPAWALSQQSLRVNAKTTSKTMATFQLKHELL
jgi:hypothetical protein